MRSKSGPFPLLPKDRIWKDLLIVSEELDDIVTDVAERAGYSDDDLDLNPMYGGVSLVLSNSDIAHHAAIPTDVL